MRKYGILDLYGLGNCKRNPTFYISIHRAAHDYHDHDDYSDSEPEYEPEPEGSELEDSKPEGSGPEPEGSGPEPEGSDPEKEDSDTDSDPEAGYDVPKRV